MFKKIKAIRGATGSENTNDDITKNVCELCNQIFIKNKLKQKDLISIQFSITEDINILNPATALRKGMQNGTLVFDSSKPALFCTQEAKITGGAPKMIRVLITAYSKNPVKNIYINGGEKLRPDLAGTK